MLSSLTHHEHGHTLHGLLLANAFSSVSVTNLNETGLLPGMGNLNDFSSYRYVYTCTGVVHWCTCEFTLNTLERTVEQLAGCLAKETKASSRGQSTIACKRRSLPIPLRIFNKMT